MAYSIGAVAEIFHTSWFDLVGWLPRRILAGGPSQGGAEVGDLDFFHFGIEIDAAFGNEDGFLAGGAVWSICWGRCSGVISDVFTMTTRRWIMFSSWRTLPGQL